MKRIACSGIGLVLSLGLLGSAGWRPESGSANSQSSASGTSDGSSLGDYARQVRKDPGAKPKQRVFDNDNLPTEDKLSIVGPAAAATPASDTSADAKPADSSCRSSGACELQATPRLRPKLRSRARQARRRRQGPAQKLSQVPRG